MPVHPIARVAAAAALIATCATTLAAPAPWFYYRSIVTGERVCAQFTPGDGWVQESTPYKDARCAARY